MTELRQIQYVGWGGTTKSGPAEKDFGWAIKRKPHAPFGFHRAVFDSAWGYVNGFEFSAIAYYVLTRSLNQRIWHYAYFREYPNAKGGCGGAADARPNRPDVMWCRICYPQRGGMS